MHQVESYKDQFTPWTPCACVDNDYNISADEMQLGITYFAENDQFEKVMYFDEVLMSSLYSNGILRILMQKSLKAYNNKG